MIFYSCGYVTSTFKALVNDIREQYLTVSAIQTPFFIGGGGGGGGGGGVISRIMPLSSGSNKGRWGWVGISSSRSMSAEAEHRECKFGEHSMSWDSSTALRYGIRTNEMVRYGTF